MSETWLKQVAYSVQDRTKMPPKDDCAKSKQQPIEWTENHDLLLMREMLISDLFLYKKGSTNRGLVWDSIVENLNLIETPVFGLKDKRSVRDRWTLIKYKKKTREEEAASDVAADEPTKIESLIEELCDKEESLLMLMLT